MTQHVMLDLETLGTKAGSVILSIGAVKFDPNDDEPFNDKFHVAIDPVSSQDFGLTIDAKTVLWWLDADRAEARERLLSEENVDLASALEGFSGWFGNVSLPVWGNASAFDNVLLRTAYEKAGMEPPWHFWDDRCYRTLKNIAGFLPSQFTGRTAHYALDDAISQAEHLRRIVKVLGIVL